MFDRLLGRELVIGLALGLLVNFIWALISQQFNLYQISIVFVASIVFYYLLWKFVLKPIRTMRRQKIRAVYTSFHEARPFIKQKIEEASNIKISTVGGGAIVENERGWMLETLLKRSHQDNVQIKILLLNPSSQAVKNRYKELNNLKSNKFPPEALSNYILTNTQRILERKSKIDARYYSSRPTWRLYILDDIAFVSFYLSSKEGHETQVTQLGKGSDLFAAFERTFDSLWEDGQEPSR